MDKDGTGPEGKGPRTGRQLGDCVMAKPMINRRGRLRGLGQRNRRI